MVECVPSLATPSLTMKNHQQQLASILKQLRTERKWSLDKASTETGVSKAMLGQIERRESSPTIATLWKIATGFHIALSSLVEEQPTKNEAVVVTSHRRVILDQTDTPLEPLFAYDPKTGIELFVIDLAAGKTHLSPAHDSGVTEHIIVIAGKMEVLVDNQWYSLEQGEAMKFDAHRPHGYRNASDKKCCFHSLIHYRSARG